MIATKIDVNCQRIENLDESLEHVSILLTFHRSQYVIYTIYIPPNSPINVYEKTSRSLLYIRDCYPDAELIITGDFNLRKTDWLNSFLCSKPISRFDTPPHIINCSQVFSYAINFLNLFQLNDIYNPSKSLLDLIFVTRDYKVELSDEPLTRIDSHHPPLVCRIAGARVCPSTTFSQKLDFVHADYFNCVWYLNNYDWDTIFAGNEINVDVSVFEDILFDCFHRFVPLKKKNASNNYPPWFTSELKTLIIDKKIAHKKFKRTRSPSDYEIFSKLRSHVKRLSHVAHDNFCKNKEDRIRENPGDFFKIVNENRNDNVIPQSLTYNNVSSSNIKESCELFADFFSCVYEPPNDIPVSNIPVADDSNIVLNHVYISLEKIFRELSCLKNNRGPGPDRIPNIFLSNCVYALAKPLHILFNKSLSTGVFPDAWKKSRITPIFKSGCKNDVSNYRPISILNSVPKLFEKLATPLLYAAFKPTIINEQHGFVDSRSTVSNLACMENRIARALECRGQVDVIYTDFAKAFDKVSHNVLQSKLKKLGVANPILAWISSYLHNRKQLVHIGGYSSREFDVTSGVPQGSHLGPLLFIIFINDLKSVLKFSDILLYADDAKIYCDINSLNDAENVQTDLDAVYSWCNSNRMFLNISKCSVVRYTNKKQPFLFDYKLNNSVLAVKEEIKDLGVTFSSNGSFKSHIEKTKNKALRVLGFINRNVQIYKYPSTYFLLFNTLVRPHLEYGSPVWSPSSKVDMKLLETVQSKFMRKLAFMNWTPLPFDCHDYSEIKSQFGIKSLDSRRKIADLIFLYKILNREIDCPYLLGQIRFHIPSRDTRLQQLFAIPYHRTALADNQCISRMCKLGNEISHHINFFTASLTTFTQFIHSYFAV